MREPVGFTGSSAALRRIGTPLGLLLLSLALALALPAGALAFATAAGLTPRPSITGFTPRSGRAGTTVTLTGTNFGGATAVAFPNAAASFTIISGTEIKAQVPRDAFSGTVAVTTAGGTAFSAERFTVLPTKVTLGLSGIRRGAVKLGARVTATGMVTPMSLYEIFTRGEGDVSLTAQRRQNRRWVTAMTASVALKSWVSDDYNRMHDYIWKYRPAKKGAYRLRAAVPQSTLRNATTTAWQAFRVN